MTSKGCKQHAKGEWCIYGCNWNVRVCHRFARGQQCPPRCRYVHLSHQKTGDEQYDNPNHEQTPEPKAMPKPKARHTTSKSHEMPRPGTQRPRAVKSKATAKRRAVSTKTAEALRELDIDPASSISRRQITARYHKGALIHHPDKVQHWTKDKMQKAVLKAEIKKFKAVHQAEDEMQKEVQQAEEEMQKEVQWAAAKMQRLNNARDVLDLVYP